MKTVEEMRKDELTAKFRFYKKRLIKECQNPQGIRYSVIEFLCNAPDLDPIEMAASLQNDGYEILFDDTAISKAENASIRAKVNRAARGVQSDGGNEE